MAWSISDIPLQRGRIAVVTGTGGLGYETALELARAGAEVIIAGRNSGKGADAIVQINMQIPHAKINFEILDLSDLVSIGNFSQRISERVNRIDLLINNAGVMMPPTRKSTVNGFELQFGTNHLGHFALTRHLLPLMRNAPSPRVVSVASQAYRGGKIAFNDLQSEHSYNAYKAYAQSKLAQVIFATELQRRSDKNGWRITSSAAHPGWAKTELFKNGPGPKSFSNWLNKFIAEPLFAQSAADGALPTLYAATAPEACKGGFYGPDGFLEMKGAPKRTEISSYAKRLEVAIALWEISETLIGAKY